MGTFVHLVRKELRDVRWLVRGGALGFAAVAFAAAWVVRRHWSGPVTDVKFAAEVVRGAGLLAASLCGSAVAAELFAGEAVSRRIDAAALLPVSLDRVFRAKLAALLVACLTLAAWGIAAASAA